jgi:predicted nucleotidyltransferase component of viral defense system
MNDILTSFQKELLKEIGHSNLSKYFTWSGGTALSFYYLQHRKSFDLDFLSKELLPDDYLLIEIKKITVNLKVKKIEEQKILNRRQFWFNKNKETIKIEFVFYPFPSVKKPAIIKEFNLKIDSLEDILTNKVHSVFERAEPKDVFDIYCILQKKKIKFSQMFKWAKKKFGAKIDPVLWSAKVLESAEKLNNIKPLILKRNSFKAQKIKDYFEKEAHNYLRKKIR